MTSSRTSESNPTSSRSATPAAKSSTRTVALNEVPEECRAWMALIADLLIPSDGRMPAASEAGVAGGQLDLILRARADLYPHLLRAWVTTQDLAPQDALDVIQDLDAEGYDAVRILVAGGYYSNPEIRQLLGYTGQQPKVVRVDNIPAYVEEGLLERVIERGPLYREP
jgi:hypothetical protein